MKLACLTSILFVLCTHVFAQSSAADSTQLHLQPGISIEMHNTNNFGLSLGGMLGTNLGKTYAPNYALGIYADVIFVNQPIIGQRVKVNLNHLGIFGINFNVANYYRNGQNDFRITPEINFSYQGKVNLFAGYNFSISDHKFSEIGDFKLGMNVNLVR